MKVQPVAKFRDTALRQRSSDRIVAIIQDALTENTSLFHLCRACLPKLEIAALLGLKQLIDSVLITKQAVLERGSAQYFVKKYPEYKENTNEIR